MRSWPCPCCGYLTLSEGPGSDDICPICFWEDDLSQLRFVTMAGGANLPSLVDAQRNFATFGAAEQRLVEHARRPDPTELRDQEWRLIELTLDNVEVPQPGLDYGKSYPGDLSTLYYWRRTYWRKAAT